MSQSIEENAEISATTGNARVSFIHMWEVTTAESKGRRFYNLYYCKETFQTLRSIGHNPLLFSLLVHFRIQCIWKTWEHAPHNNGQSSPGTLQSGHVISYAFLQIPQDSSSWTFHFQRLTCCQLLILTFILNHTRTPFLNEKVEAGMEHGVLCLKFAKKIYRTSPQNLFKMYDFVWQRDGAG